MVGKLGIDIASSLYSTASSVLGRAEKSAHVFVRDKDELWRAEAIGKFGPPGQGVPTYVMTYLLVDPFRSGDPPLRLDLMALSQRVEREIPEIMPFYSLLVQNGVNVRYSVLVEYARNEGKAPADWQCETLRKRWPSSQ